MDAHAHDCSRKKKMPAVQHTRTVIYQQIQENMAVVEWNRKGSPGLKRNFHQVFEKFPFLLVTMKPSSIHFHDIIANQKTDRFLQKPNERHTLRKFVCAKRKTFFGHLHFPFLSNGAELPPKFRNSVGCPEDFDCWTFSRNRKSKPFAVHDDSTSPNKWTPPSETATWFCTVYSFSCAQSYTPPPL